MPSITPTIPHDATAPCQSNRGLTSLPHDLVSVILAHLDDIDHPSLSNAALVSSALYGKARYQQHQTVRIDVGDEHSHRRLRWMTQDGLLCAVRTLHVNVPDHIHLHVDTPPPDGNGPASEELAVWSLLATLIPRMPGLRQLHWTGTALPEAVVQHLAANPHISLHLLLRATDRQSHLPGRLARLNLLNQLPATVEPAAGNLSSLHVGLTYCSPELCRPVMQTALKHLLLSTPGLRSLSLDVSYRRDHGAAFEDDAKRQYCGFGFVKREAPAAALEELEVINYPFGKSATASPELEELTALMSHLEGYPHPKLQEGQDWARRFDWSRLRRLRLHPAASTLFSYLVKELSALESFELVCPAECTGSAALGLSSMYLFQLPATARLATLTLPRLYPVTELEALPHLSQHAASLRHLTVFPTPSETADLASLAKALGGLETLDVVCSREYDDGQGGWPEEAFGLLASSFRDLRELTVRFDAGPPGRRLVPCVTAAAAREVAGRIRMLNQKGPGGLQKVTVRSGVVLPWDMRGYAQEEKEGWKRDQEVGFECVWRGSAAGDGEEETEVRCLGLSDVQNGRLRELVAACEADGKEAMEGMMTEEERGDIRFAVALNGPMTMNEWRAWNKARE